MTVTAAQNINNIIINKITNKAAIGIGIRS